MRHKYTFLILICYILHFVLSFGLSDAAPKVTNILAYGLIVILLGIVLISFKNALIKHSVLISFVVPYSLWTSLATNTASGLWKARWYEQAITFIVTWAFFGAICYAVLSILKYLKSEE